MKYIIILFSHSFGFMQLLSSLVYEVLSFIINAVDDLMLNAI